MIWEKILNILFLLLPTQLGRHFWPKEAFLFGLKVDYLSPTLYLQDILILLLIFFWLGQNKPKIFTKRLSLFSFLYLLFAISNIFVSPTPLVSFFFWLRVSEFLCLGIVVAKNFSRAYSLLGKVLPFSLIFESFLGLGQVLRQSSFGGLFWLLGERSFNIFTPGIAQASWLGKVVLRPYGTFSHPNSLAGFTLVSLILLLGKEKLAAEDKFAILLGSVLIFLSFSRVVWFVSFLLGLGVLFWQLRKSLIGGKTLLTFGYSLTLLLLPLIIYFFSRTTIDPASFSIRRQLADFAIVLVKRTPFLGIGAGRFVISLSQDQPVWQWLYWLQPVHNIFLLLGAETGLAGLSLFLFLLAFAFKKLLSSCNCCLVGDKQASKQTRYRCFSLIAALSAILFTGLFDHYWLTLIQNQLLFTIVLGLAMG